MYIINAPKTLQRKVYVERKTLEKKELLVHRMNKLNKKQHRQAMDYQSAEVAIELDFLRLQFFRNPLKYTFTVVFQKNMADRNKHGDSHPELQFLPVVALNYRNNHVCQPSVYYVLQTYHFFSTPAYLICKSTENCILCIHISSS